MPPRNVKSCFSSEIGAVGPIQLQPAEMGCVRCGSGQVLRHGGGDQIGIHHRFRGGDDAFHLYRPVLRREGQLPDVFGDGYKYLKLCAHFRQYLPVMSDNRMTFAYHLAYQGTVGGRVPFYMQSNITTLYLRQINSEGLGSINTVRGTLYNRMIGDSYAWANFEMRIKLLSFDFINQSWYLAANPFFDLGAIVKPYRLDEYPSVAVFPGASFPVPKSFTGPVNEKDATKLHESVGAGLKLVMNQNFIVGCEVAKALDPDDNPGLGINIGLNYIF